jgi:ER lumen protein retaining receptor
MSKKVGSVDLKIGYYLLFMGLSRFFRLVFWILMWMDGDDFLYLIAADLIHSLILADFVWMFFKYQKEDCILLM